jgi:hypothetical protein
MTSGGRHDIRTVTIMTPTRSALQFGLDEHGVPVLPFGSSGVLARWQRHKVGVYARALYSGGYRGTQFQATLGTRLFYS